MSLASKLAALMGQQATVWNAWDKSAQIALSGGDLTATGGNTSTTYTSVRASAGMTAGKFYWEEKVVSASVSNILAGAALTTMSLDQTSIATSGVCAATADKHIYVNGSSSGTDFTAASTAHNDVICIALDLDNKRFWARLNGGNWNNSGAGNPATNTGGIDISALSGTFEPFFGTKAAGDAVTANFGVTAYSFTAPAGFGNWR